MKRPEVTTNTEGEVTQIRDNEGGELADESVTHAHWNSLPSGRCGRLVTVGRHGNNFQPPPGLPEVKAVICEINNTWDGNRDIAKEKTDDLEHMATDTLQVNQGMLGIR